MGETQPSETKPKKIVRRTVVVALGIVCIVLIVVGLVGAVTYVIPIINDKNNMISSLNTQISQLDSNVTSLQNQVISDNSTIRSLTSNVTILQEALNDLLNETAWVGLDELQASYLNYLNRTVAVEGNLSGPFLYSPENMPPWDYEWVNPDGTLNNDFGVLGLRGLEASFDSTNVIVIGVVREGNRVFDGGLLPACFIEAERIILL